MINDKNVKREISLMKAKDMLLDIEKRFGKEITFVACRRYRDIHIYAMKKDRR